MQTLSPKARELFAQVASSAKELESAAYAGMSRGTIQRRGWKIRDDLAELERYVKAVEARADGGELADVPAKGSRKVNTAGRTAGKNAEPATAR